MRNYQYILLDLDDTLLDWHKTEEIGLRATMREVVGRELTPEEVRCYNVINAGVWKRYEKKEVTKDELKRIRFLDFFKALGIPAEDELVDEVNRFYMQYQSHVVVEFPDAQSLCRGLAAKYKLILITNGTDWVQRGRLSGTSFADVFTGVVISDEVGCSKPDPAFFEGVKAITGDSDVSRYLVVGDSLSSDIAFGRAIGADTLWVHTRDDGQSGDATYTVRSLAEVGKLLLGD
ncbi:MAG: HAD-IA family hydrolase [Lachnospiraceae bacterium]|nr:HAD-IA family hydrolase [Lachnospiraceae bacterium]